MTQSVEKVDITAAFITRIQKLLEGKGANDVQGIIYRRPHHVSILTSHSQIHSA